MTTGADDALFLAEFCPELGEYLAGQHAAGYDAEAGRARFLTWLTEHAEPGPGAGTGTGAGLEAGAGPGADDGGGTDGEELPALRDAAEPLRSYLAQISQVPGLTARQEAELATRVLAGRHAERLLAEGGSPQVQAGLEWVAEEGARAKHRLLEASLRLVADLASRYADRGVPLIDLIEQGNLGLIRALERLDETHAFSAHVTWWIRQAITQILADRERPEGARDDGP